PELLLIDGVRDAAGLDLLRALKGEPRWRDIPVLVVADHPPDDAAVWTFGMGAADFLRKPFRVRELLARMEAQLRVRRMLLDAREALRTAESELQRVRDEADSRRRLVDIVHEVTGELVPTEIYARLTRKVGQELNLSHASVVLAQPGDEAGIVAAAFENPSLREYPVDLSRYPEITTALDQRRLVLVEDVASSAVYAHTRARWESEGTVVSV